MVHEPVHPVEIRIMNKQRQTHTRQQIAYTVRINAVVHHGKSCQRTEKEKVAQRCKNKHGGNRIRKLPSVVRRYRKLQLNLPPGLCFFPSNIEQQEGHGSQDQVSKEDDQQNHKEFVVQGL